MNFKNGIVSVSVRNAQHIWEDDTARGIEENETVCKYITEGNDC